MSKIGRIICFVAIVAIAYIIGRNTAVNECSKHYQAACILNDVCHNMVDNIGVDAEEIYCEYIDNLDCYGLTITREDINEYYWSY